MSQSCPVCNHPARVGARFCSACGAALAVATSLGRLAIGQVLNGRYRVVRPLSKGGMGAIYLVEDNSVFGKQRVLKEMLDYVDPADYPDAAAYQQAVQHAHQRFEEEARTLASLRHHGIPDIMEYFSEGGHNYIVMEYIEGMNLEQRLTHDDAQGRRIAGRPYPADEVIRYGIQVCKVLEYLVGLPKTVVHQDIKPANLIVDGTGAVWLVDFGTAKARLAVGPGGKVGLQKSSVYGTVGYAPREQYKGQSEPRSDVYALGATLYHLATDDDRGGIPSPFPGCLCCRRGCGLRWTRRCSKMWRAGPARPSCGASSRRCWRRPTCLIRFICAGAGWSATWSSWRRRAMAAGRMASSICIEATLSNGCASGGAPTWRRRRQTYGSGLRTTAPPRR